MSDGSCAAASRKGSLRFHHRDSTKIENSNRQVALSGLILPANHVLPHLRPSPLQHGQDFLVNIACLFETMEGGGSREI
jgi:hypothetical protein